jgi:hypothetical protein
MTLLRQVIVWEVWIFLGSLLGIIFMRMLNGEINTRHLLYGRRRGRGGRLEPYFSPERVQLLIFTLATAFQYVTGLLQNPVHCKLPDLPQSVVAALGGSHAVYLGGKAYSMLMRNTGPKENQ